MAGTIATKPRKGALLAFLGAGSVVLVGALAYVSFSSEAGGGARLALEPVAATSTARAVDEEKLAAEGPDVRAFLNEALVNGGAEVRGDQATRMCDALARVSGDCRGVIAYGGQYFEIDMTVL